MLRTQDNRCAGPDSHAAAALRCSEGGQLPGAWARRHWGRGGLRTHPPSSLLEPFSLCTQKLHRSFFQAGMEGEKVQLPPGNELSRALRVLVFGKAPSTLSAMNLPVTSAHGQPLVKPPAPSLQQQTRHRGMTHRWGRRDEFTQLPHGA